jgi:DNA-binding NtrC family response regulator
MGTTDKRLQTIAFQLDVEVFDQLWNAAKDLGVSIDEILRQAVSIWLSQRAPKGLSELEKMKENDDKIRSLDDSEQALILQTLEKFNGNKSKAAEALGISTRTLYRRLEKY